ncbi:ArsR family transcriptional regulator [Luteolibacter sp. Populi]|uniref:ArsR family transcriptional regulator n=1 Tax=Luteolibacter sp. Populi TaxID=3230487 RepID=UPI0034653FB8
MSSTALADLFGSRAAEAVLLHVYHYGESYGRAVSADFAISLDSVQRQLEKFSRAGTLVSKSQGRTLVYTWNAKSRLAARLKDLVAVIYEGISAESRAEFFGTRRRPRAKGKPVISQAEK